MNIKSITLTFDEIEDLLSIDDPELRRQAVRAMRDAADNPDAIDLKSIRKDKSTTSTIVRKIHRKAKAARRRATKKTQNKPTAQPAALEYLPEYIYVDYHLTANRLLKISHLYHDLHNDLKRLTSLLDAGCEGDSPAMDCLGRFTKSISSFLNNLYNFVCHIYNRPQAAREAIDEIIRISFYNPYFQPT